MNKLKFIYSIAVVITALFTPTETLAQIIRLNRLPAAIEEVRSELPMQLNDTMFWIDCYRNEDNTLVEVVIQVNDYYLDVSTSEYIENLKKADDEEICEILGDEIISFIYRCPLPVRVYLAFTDFTDFYIMFNE